MKLRLVVVSMRAILRGAACRHKYEIHQAGLDFYG